MSNWNCIYIKYTTNNCFSLFYVRLGWMWALNVTWIQFLRRHAVQSPNAINREMNIQDPSCATHANEPKLFIFYLRVVSPKFTALMVYLVSLLPSTLDILNAGRLLPSVSRHLQLPPSWCTDGWAHVATVLINGSTRTWGCRRILLHHHLWHRFVFVVGNHLKRTRGSSLLVLWTHVCGCTVSCTCLAKPSNVALPSRSTSPHRVLYPLHPSAHTSCFYFYSSVAPLLCARCGFYALIWKSNRAIIHLFN